MNTDAPAGPTNAADSDFSTSDHATPGTPAAPRPELPPHHQYVYVSRGPWPHLRHVARVNQITFPTGYFETGAAIITGELAITLCGLFLRDYWEGGNLEALATDGSQFLIECARCTTRQAAAERRWKGAQAELSGVTPANSHITLAEDLERR